MRLKLIALFCLGLASLVAAEERPKIGLALSGGGAKGFAHVGIIKVLDSLQVPVDYIAGTSMGGIIGGLYAIGYDAYDMEQIATQIDWQEILTDKPRRTSLPYLERIETCRYQLEFGLREFTPVSPSGLIFGQKVSLLLLSFTFPHERTTEFDDLPIPFRCVAVDLVTGNEVVLGNGSLAKAMRATMAIPTVFSPVEWGDSLLVDGGVRNNLPVDIVRGMGADFVIAVDVSAPLLKREQLNSAFGTFNQLQKLMGAKRLRDNLEDADFVIHPNISGLSAGDFNRDEVRTILLRGKQTAHDSLPGLLAMLRDRNLLPRSPVAVDSGLPARIHSIRITGRKTIPDTTLFERLAIRPDDTLDRDLLRQRIAGLKISNRFEDLEIEIEPRSPDAVDITLAVKERKEPFIRKLSVRGNQMLSADFIQRLIGLNSGSVLNVEQLEERIMEIYGLDYFESVLYETEFREDNRVDLIVRVKELPANRLRLGLRYDDFHKLVGVASVRANNILLSGLRWTTDIQFAGLFRYHLDVSYPSRTLNLPVYPFLRLDYKDIPTNVFDARGVRIARYKDRSFQAELGAAFLLFKSFNAELAYQQEFVRIRPTIALDDPVTFPSFEDELRRIHASITLDLLDDVLLPSNGLLLRASYEGSLNQLGTDADYDRFQGSLDIYNTFSRKHTGRLYGFWGQGFGDLPIYRFFYQRRPEDFVGMDYDQLYGIQMMIVRGEYRYEYRRDIFLKLIANAAFRLKFRTPIQSLQRAHTVRGLGLGLTLLSPLGPLEIIYSVGDKNFSGKRELQSLWYLTFGYKF